jgi:hypothetical protein
MGMIWRLYHQAWENLKFGKQKNNPKISEYISDHQRGMGHSTTKEQYFYKKPSER